jgi:AcrR family transcriptional regulator
VARPVKPRRYDASARQAASHERRARILAAAREVFLQRGYSAATMAAIADRSGTAVDTVYELVGRKPELFRLLIETAISGGDEAVPAEEREYVQRMRAEPTSAGALAVYARALPAIHARLAPLVAVLQAAAAAEPQLAELWHEISERRAANMHRFATQLDATGELAVSAEHAADVIWATNSSELYLLLVGQRGWTQQRYSDWLEDTWCRLLLHADPARPARPRASRRVRRAPR